MTGLDFTEDYIAHLIIACLEGRSSEKEIRQLRKWLEGGEGNRRFFREFERTWLEAGQSAYDSRQAWNRLETTLETGRRRSRIRFFAGVLRYAVAVILLLAVCRYGYLHYNDDRKPDGMEEIVPGSNRAVLVLGGDRRISLNARTSDTLLHGKAFLEPKSGILVYRGKEKDVQEEENILITPRGGEYSLILSDGTRVWLNAESELRYPVRFHGKIRQVWLKGEAYFDVERQDDIPFRVCSGETGITVFGTEFNVRNYGGGHIETTLVSGSVRVASSYGGECRLLPGQQAVLEGRSLSVRDVEVTWYTAWKDGYFVYNNRPLEEIMQELSRWYDFDYFYQNASLQDMHIIARLRKFDNVDEIFGILSATGHLDFKTNGRTVTVRAR